MACGWYGISRQSYYQARKRQIAREAEDELLIELVRAIRQKHPRMGGRKLHYKLQAPMANLAIYRGRDAFFKVLREKDLLVPRKRSGRRTTRSGLWRYPNLFADLDLQRANQAWVGDITYITTEQGFVYLALLTDAYSRFIIGYDLSSSLVAEGCLRALDRAISSSSTDILGGLIHHSDHGVQYTAWTYQERLAKKGIHPSMGEVGNCYENALAERMNGILKCEYALDSLFVDIKEAQKATREAVWLYNYERPHLSLNYATPAEIYFKAG